MLLATPSRSPAVLLPPTPFPPSPPSPPPSPLAVGSVPVLVSIAPSDVGGREAAPDRTSGELDAAHQASGKLVRVISEGMGIILPVTLVLSTVVAMLNTVV